VNGVEQSAAIRSFSIQFPHHGQWQDSMVVFILNAFFISDITELALRKQIIEA